MTGSISPTSAASPPPLGKRNRNSAQRRRVVFLCLVLCSLLRPAFAQSATPSSKLAFDEAGQTVAVAGGATYNVYIDAAGAVPLSGVTCVVAVSPAPSGSTCTAPFPAMAPGAHTLTVTQVISGAESAKSTPALAVTFVVVVTPTNVRIVP